MKKILFVFILMILAVILVACVSGSSIIGKWSVDPTSVALAENILPDEQVIIEFKQSGDMVMDDLIDGTSQGTETLYYKMVDKDTIWWCSTAEECTEDYALVVDFKIENNVLTLTPQDYPDEPLILNRIP